MIARLKKTFLFTFVGALALIWLMLMFWPAPDVELPGVAECPEPEVMMVPVGFPIFVEVPVPVRFDPWKCWYSDRLEDWMCPVPAGGPFK
jgi:hypothetical protein